VRGDTTLQLFTAKTGRGDRMLDRRSLLKAAACAAVLPLSGCGLFEQERETASAQAKFLTLCDLATEELNKEIKPFQLGNPSSGDAQTHHSAFFVDSYVVRALCVAYDITGNNKYLSTCQRWSDRVIALQKLMIPHGAYYMNYGREPGATQGDWYVADSGSIAMGILATSIRTSDEHRLRYLRSVQAYAKLVAKSYFGKRGGISDGIWGQSTDEWWASTAIAGMLFAHFHRETGCEEHASHALNAFKWTLLNGLRNATNPTFEQGPAGVVFYTGEFFAVALRHGKLTERERDAASPHLEVILDWLANNQKGRGATTSVDYLLDSYMAGMPYLMYALAEEWPDAPPTLRSAADRELRYITTILFKNGSPPDLATILSKTEIPQDRSPDLWGFMSWAMMSYAEKLSPGALLRTSKEANHPECSVVELE